MVSKGFTFNSPVWQVLPPIAGVEVACAKVPKTLLTMAPKAAAGVLIA